MPLRDEPLERDSSRADYMTLSQQLTEAKAVNLRRQEEAGLDVNGFSVIGVEDALARLKQRLSGWAASGLPDNAMSGIHLGDVRRLWEFAGLEDLPIARLGGLTPRNLADRA